VDLFTWHGVDVDAEDLAEQRLLVLREVPGVAAAAVVAHGELRVAVGRAEDDALVLARLLAVVGAELGWVAPDVGIAGAAAGAGGRLRLVAVNCRRRRTAHWLRSPVEGEGHEPELVVEVHLVGDVEERVCRVQLQRLPGPLRRHGG